MNKYQEALNRICFNYGLNALDGETNEIMDEKFSQDISLIQELVEKATPKKPIKDGSGYLTCDKVQYICPRCNQIMVRVICIKSHKPNYCYKCGGALDWSEEK